jgi:integrase/recombinase XerD
MSAVAPTLQAFFSDRLLRKREASPHTVASYRDTTRLLLTFASQRAGKQPSALAFEDLDATVISGFLDHLEHDRGCGPRTRNTRLAAIRSLFRYAGLRHPEYAALIQRVLAIPLKRHDHPLLCFLNEQELNALLDAPDRDCWTGRRDHTMLMLAAQTGLRASELTGLTCADVHLQTGAHVHTIGKGRRARITPLTKATTAALRAWLAERAGNPPDPLFPTRTGKALTRDALARRLTKHTAHSSAGCPSLRQKTVTPHTLRHTAAMRLLHAGIDTSVIALWLGHQQLQTTQTYIRADLSLKEKALARTTPLDSKPGRYRPPDTLLRFLEQL